MHSDLSCKALIRTNTSDRGITLIELLVALAISLLVLFAVTNVFLSTKANTRLQAGVSRANESGQVATALLAREIRQTSHMGCPSLGKPSAGSHRANDPRDTKLFGDDDRDGGTKAVRVLSSTDTDAPPTAIAGNPILDIVHGANAGVHLAKAMVDRTVPMQVTGDPGFDAVNPTSENKLPIAIISTCTTSEIMQVAKVLKNPWRVEALDPLRVPYTTNARVMPATRTQFFMGNYTRGSGERSSRALYSRTIGRDGINWNAAQPIVHDLSAMNIIMLLDTDGDFESDAQVNFGSAYDPLQVVGLTITLTFQTPEGVTGTTGGRVTRPFTSSVSLRARIL
jgi:type IV pilus assembly protein PilW